MAQTGLSLREQSFEAEDKRLRRSLSLRQLYFLNFSSIVGSGWLFATLGADTTSGPAAVLAWAIGGVCVGLMAISFAEVGAMLPRTGGAARYPQLTHGGFTGLLLGWAYYLWAVAIPALEAEAMVTYASSYVGGLTKVSSGVTVLRWPDGIVLALVAMAVFFAINVFGVRFLARFNDVISYWKLIIPALTIIFLFVMDFHASNFTAYGGFAPFGISPIFATIVSSGIAFSILGWRQSLEFGGEAANPQRDVPLAMLLSVVTAVVLYALLQIVFTGAIPWTHIRVHPGNWAGLEASSAASAPFLKVLRASGIAFLGGFSTLLLADAYISPGGAGYVQLGSATRILYGLSMYRYLPSSLRRLSERFRIPWIALLASTVIGALFFAPLPSWYTAVGFVSSAGVLSYVMGGVLITVLRRTAPSLDRPFRVKAIRLIAPLSTMAAVVVVYWSGFTVLIDVIAAVFVIIPLYAWGYAPARKWCSARLGALLGSVFLLAWGITQYFGHWIFAPANLPLGKHLAFPLYFLLMVIELAAFMVAMWWISKPPGRQALLAGLWLVVMLMVLLCLSYYGAYGPLARPAVRFPWDTLLALAIGLGSYYWAVASGFETEEIKLIKRQAEEQGMASAPRQT